MYEKIFNTILKSERKNAGEEERNSEYKVISGSTPSKEIATFFSLTSRQSSYSAAFRESILLRSNKKSAPQMNGRWKGIRIILDLVRLAVF